MLALEPANSTRIKKTLKQDRDQDFEKNAEKINSNFFKRLLDIFLATFVLLFLFSWIFPLVTLIILIDSGFPVFFIQKRVGKNGRHFRFIKFRTMWRHEDEQIFVPTQVGDKRITKTGRFLRNSNIDELPQFINILKGDMSFIGPRPTAIPFQKKYEDLVGKDMMMKRTFVRPGIIGLSQMLGYRGDLPDENENRSLIKARVKIDLLYIKNWSLQLDALIFFRTIRNMIGRFFQS